MTTSSNTPSTPSGAAWQPGDQEAIRQCLGLPATVPCLDAIGRAMADLLRQHPAGVLSAHALLDAVALIDQQLLAGGSEQEQAIQKTSHSGPIVGSVAAAGDAPLQKADVIAYDTALLREESETTYASPSSPAMALLRQRRRYAEHLLLLLPALNSWMQLTAEAAGQPGTTPMLRG
ncbi:hypothetical protein VB734_00340 [Synechococcus sp. BA-124 BA4]|uniref:hypothetical protein n=1 Tax=unclassified Synechococcus TaxID=2626047 RepID=UPI002AD3FAD2|nr:MULTISPECIES: hypothetical protein [unclassified Synechococcus]MEA5398490.1 hypothetical protein [Synechococcus sp. BA-124 BA4]CAK6691784.1 hypothetical protein BBFGKLBO_01103 [Synechococcus sp. CBW1107]